MNESNLAGRAPEMQQGVGIRNLAFDPAEPGVLAAIRVNEAISFQDALTGVVRGRIAAAPNIDQPVNGGSRQFLAFSPDGKRPLVGMTGYKVQVWERGSDGLPEKFRGDIAVDTRIDVGSKLYKGYDPGTPELKSIDFSADGSTFAIKTNTGGIALWDAAKIEERLGFLDPIAGETSASTFRPDGTLVAAVFGAKVLFINPRKLMAENLSSVGGRAKALKVLSSGTWTAADAGHSVAAADGSAPGDVRGRGL